MEIRQILMQPIGQRFNAGTLTIKTCKKTWQVKDVWYHQVKLMDETGEIPADVRIGKYLPLQRSSAINVIIADVRDGEYLGKRSKVLFVEQYSLPTQTVNKLESKQDEWQAKQQDEIESKVRCWLVSASIQGRKLTKAEILEWQEFVMTGEVK